jgi:hypothetical protein
LLLGIVNGAAPALASRDGEDGVPRPFGGLLGAWRRVLRIEDQRNACLLDSGQVDRFAEVEPGHGVCVAVRGSRAMLDCEGKLLEEHTMNNRSRISAPALDFFVRNST